MSLQIRVDQAPLVAALAERQPGITWVVDYLGPTAFHDRAASAAVCRLAGAPNIWYKLLALGTDFA